MKNMKWLPCTALVLLAGLVCVPFASAQSSTASQGSKADVLRKKALDAVEIQAQLIKTDTRGGEVTITPVEAFLINTETFTVDDLYTLFDWATSEERGETVYSFRTGYEKWSTNVTFSDAAKAVDSERSEFGATYMYNKYNDKTHTYSEALKINVPKGHRYWQEMDSWKVFVLCNALSELCGLTPVYWESNAKGFSPMRVAPPAYKDHDRLHPNLSDGSGGVYIMPNADGFRIASDKALSAADSYIENGEETLFFVRNVPNTATSEE